jgi:hypothetical protein
MGDQFLVNASDTAQQQDSLREYSALTAHAVAAKHELVQWHA